MISKKLSLLKTKMSLVGLIIISGVLILGLNGCSRPRSHQPDQKLVSSFQTNKTEFCQLIKMIQEDGLALSNGETGERLILFPGVTKIFPGASELVVGSKNLSPERVEQYKALSEKSGVKYIFVTFDNKGVVSSVDLGEGWISSDQEPSRKLETWKGLRWSASTGLKTTDGELPTQHRSLSNLNRNDIKKRERVRVEQNRQIENNWYLHFYSEDQYFYS